MSEIVQSLFGVTPQSYQRQQQDRIDAQALRFAELDPFQQAQFSINRGANMLGGAIGGALGGQDPELQRITMRQQIAGQLNPNDPASIQQAIAALQQSGDTEGAMMLQSEFRKLQESNALVAQRGAATQASLASATRERTPAVPTDIQVARELSELETTAGSLESMEPSPGRDQALRVVNAQLKNLRNLTAKPGDKAPSVGTDREAVAAEQYGRPFAQLTQAERAAVNKRVQDESRARTPSQTFVMPGQKQLVDIPGFRAKVQSTIDPQSKTVFATDNALTNIQDSIDTGNFLSFRAAQVGFARAIAGAGDLSQRELQAAGADPSLLGGTADTISRLFTSTPTLDTQNKMKRTLEAIKKVSTDKANAEIERQRRIAQRNPDIDSAAVNDALDFPEFQAAPTPAPAASDLASQAAAELARRRATSGGR